MFTNIFANILDQGGPFFKPILHWNRGIETVILSTINGTNGVFKISNKFASSLKNRLKNPKFDQDKRCTWWIMWDSLNSSLKGRGRKWRNIRGQLSRNGCQKASLCILRDRGHYTRGLNLKISSRFVLKSSICVVQKATAPDIGVEFRQGSIGAIGSSLAASYDVSRRRLENRGQTCHTQTHKSTYRVAFRN